MQITRQLRDVFERYMVRSYVPDWKANDKDTKVDDRLVPLRKSRTDVREITIDLWCKRGGRSQQAVQDKLVALAVQRNKELSQEQPKKKQRTKVHELEKHHWEALKIFSVKNDTIQQSNNLDKENVIDKPKQERNLKNRTLAELRIASALDLKEVQQKARAIIEKSQSVVDDLRELATSLRSSVSPAAALPAAEKPAITAAFKDMEDFLAKCDCPDERQILVVNLKMTLKQLPRFDYGKLLNAGVTAGPADRIADLAKDFSAK